MAVTQSTVLSEISSKFSALTEKHDSLSRRLESIDDSRTRPSDGNYRRSHDNPNRGIDSGCMPGSVTRGGIRSSLLCLLVGKIPKTVCIAPLRTVMLRPRVANVAAVDRNYKETTLELYYRADTSVLGKGDIVIADFNEPVNVKDYDPVLGSKTYQNISGEIGYLRPVSGESFHIVIHQSIHIPTLEHHFCVPCNDAWQVLILIIVLIF